MAFYVKIVEITSQLYKALKFILDLKRETDLIMILHWSLLLSTRYDKMCIHKDLIFWIKRWLMFSRWSKLGQMFPDGPRLSMLV